MKTPLFLSLFLCLFVTKAYGYDDRLYGSGDYGSKELSSNLITRIVQDDHGYIWVATEYGLNKFDGINFTPYLHNEKDSTSLLSNNVRALFIDKENTLWVGTNEGLQYYLPKENRFKKILFLDDIPLHIAHICQLHDGNIWVATSGAGVFSIDKESGKATLLEEIMKLTGGFTNYIYEDKQLNIWIGLHNKGIIKINPLTKEHTYYSRPDIPHNNVIGMVEDHDGQMYMTTSTGACYYDKTKERFIPMEMDILGIGISNMFVTRKGAIYVATNGFGLKYIDKEQKKLLTLTNVHSAYNYEKANVPVLIEDRDQNLWLGCFRKGLLMIPNEQTQFDYQRIFDKEHQMGSTLNFILKDRRGCVWYGTNQDGVFKCNREGKVVKRFTERLNLTALYEDSDHTLWAGSYHGLEKLDKNSGKYHSANIPSPGYIKFITEGPDNHLYISTFGHGFMSYNTRTGNWEHFHMKQEDPVKGRLDNDWVNTIVCDKQGLIWLGHYKGVSCFDPVEKRFIKGKYSEVLDLQICISLMVGKEGEIWAGTYNGLFRIDKETGEIKRYSVNNGLSSNVICGLAQDEKGDIWCSTFNGINQIKTDENRIVNYYIGNGLVEKTYNRGVYFQRGSGTIYFGGNNGITSFYPYEIETPSYNHEVTITNVYVNNQPINTTTLSGGKPIVRTDLFNAKELGFSYEDNTFTFEFSTMDFKSPENIYYEYRVKEFGNVWSSTLPGISRITYNHLNPGKYTLLVRACKYGAYSPEKELIITVYPPWYRSAWAYITYLVVLFSIGSLIINLIRRKRNEKLNESKLQTFINISHEIRSPLTLIISPMEKLLKGDFDPKTTKTLQVMYRNSIRVLGLVNQLLDVRRIDKGQMKMNYSETDMDAFIKELMDVFEYQAAKKDIHLHFRNETENLNVWIDRNNFDKILMNLLSNAFKYTPEKGEIAILLKTGTDDNTWGPLRNYFEISVIDSGIGLEESEKEKIFERFYQGHNQETFTSVGSGIGLHLTQKLVLLHQGTISAGNRTDAKGSCFTVRIPMGKEHLKKEEFAKGEVKRALNQELFLPEVEDKEKSVKRKTNYKVLVVDDDEEIREYLKQELRETYKVITAANGVEGFKSAISESPDLIISDVMMPEMDGFKLVNKLKGNTNVSHIPVILLTSKTEHEDRINALEKGADAYLTKPFNSEELLVTVANLISGRKMLKSKFSGAQDQTDKVKNIDFKSSDEILIEKIMQQVNENIGNPEFNVEALASNVGLSRVQLHRRLKELTGLPAGEFIRNIRLKQAAGLLKEKQMNISQVAYATGFLSVTHFSTTFKKFYGISPTDFITQSNEATTNEKL